MKIPELFNWKQWNYEDYLIYFNGTKAVRRRTLRGDKEFAEFIGSLGEEEKSRFFKPVREKIKQTYLDACPIVSIIMPAFNEQIEILPTILSYTLLDTEGIPVELIIVDNVSSDDTGTIIEHCGVKHVKCEQKGVAYARAAGFQASNSASRYIWITDSDTRVIPPISDLKTTGGKSSVLQTAFKYMEQNENMLGVSTGALFECAHWSYRLVHFLAISLRRTHKLSCWSGRNQFIRRNAIEELGGIDVTVDFNEDHHRHYQLARLGKKTKKQLDSGNRNPQLIDPVYSSGRRYASLKLVVEHLREHFDRQPLERDQYGYPIHPQNIAWRDVRGQK